MVAGADSNVYKAILRHCGMAKLLTTASADEQPEARMCCTHPGSAELGYVFLDVDDTII